MSPQPISVLLEGYDNLPPADQGLALHVIRHRKLQQVRPHKVNLPQPNVSQRSLSAIGRNARPIGHPIAVPRNQCHTAQHQQDDRELSQACLRRWAQQHPPSGHRNPATLSEGSPPASESYPLRSIRPRKIHRPMLEIPLAPPSDNPRLMPPPPAPIPQPENYCNALMRNILPQLQLVATPAHC